MSDVIYRRTTLGTLLLVLIVVVLGAWVRLSDAGLGCPDWPGCYGHVGVPNEAHEVAAANEAYPDRPVEAHKAWKEMIHRYAASLLGLCIIVLTYMAWKRHTRLGEQDHVLAGVTLLWVIFQGLLGMWTVTLKVNPTIVALHLAGGLLTLSLVWLLVLRQCDWFRNSSQVFRRMRSAASVGLIILCIQILLGGWVSTNYAALACTDFPTCHGQWLPDMDIREGFVLWRPLGVDYEFGVLDAPARTAVHFAHRVGALLTFLYLLTLSVMMIRNAVFQMRSLGFIILLLLCVQVLLGIGNVLFSLPLAVAVAHNAGAALLLLSLVALNYAGARRAEWG